MDGSSTSSYTFGGFTANGTVAASSSNRPRTITAFAGTAGTISPTVSTSVWL